MTEDNGMGPQDADGIPPYRLFALSLVAIKQEGDDSLIDHMASFATARTEDEAQAEGFHEAREEWPEEEGWEISVSSAEIRADAGPETEDG